MRDALILVLLLLALNCCGGADPVPFQRAPVVPQADAESAALYQRCKAMLTRACPFDAPDTAEGSAWCAPLVRQGAVRALHGAWASYETRAWEWTCTDTEATLSVWCATMPGSWPVVQPGYPLRLP